MASYVFSCCGRVVVMADEAATMISVPHLCIGDIPCIGTANLVGAPSITLVNTEAIDPISNVVVGTDFGTPNNGDGQ